LNRFAETVTLDAQTGFMKHSAAAKQRQPAVYLESPLMDLLRDLKAMEMYLLGGGDVEGAAATRLQINDLECEAQSDASRPPARIKGAMAYGAVRRFAFL
jgi:hypothetical protein